MVHGEVEAKEHLLEHFQHDRSFREDLVYSLSFAGSSSLESDLQSDNTSSLIDDRMKRMIKNSYKALMSPSDYEAQRLRSQLPPQLSLDKSELLANTSIKRKLPPLEEEDNETISETQAQPLPKSIYQISPSKLDRDARAIVVTDSKNPYNIVAVNTSWENLCGYSREECQGHSLGPLLQGPETDMDNVMGLVSKLLTDQAGEAILTNYTKNGRKFQNRVRVGPIKDEMGKTVNFVGVLQEMAESEASRNVSSGGKMQLPFMA